MSRADISAGKAHVALYVKNSQFMKGLNQASKQMESLGKDIMKIGVPFQALGASILAPIAGTIKVASDMEEQMNKFNVVFGENADAMKSWGDEVGAAMGRGSLQMVTFLGSLQDLLVPMGMAPAKARELSKEMTTLAIDVASFNNAADEDVLRDFQAALTGSGEVMKKYGVIVSEARVKQQLLNEGLDPKNVTEAQKAMARWTLILEGTTAAQGDAIRSAGSFANQMKALKANISGASVAVGSVLLPAIAGVIPRIREIVLRVTEWAKTNSETIKTIAAVGLGLVAFGTTIQAVGFQIFAAAQVIKFFTAVVTTATKAITLIGTMTAALATPLGAITFAVAALGVYWLTMTESGQKAAAGLMKAFWDAKAFVGETVGAMFEALTDGRLELAAQIAAVSIEVAFIEAFERIKEAAFSMIGDLIETIGTAIISPSAIGKQMKGNIGARGRAGRDTAVPGSEEDPTSARARRAALIEEARRPAEARKAQQAAAVQQGAIQADIRANQQYRPTDGNAVVMAEYAAERQRRMEDPTTHRILQQILLEQRQARAVYQ